MNKKNILLVTPELQYTGALNSFRRICKVLYKNNYNIEIWTLRDGPFRDELSVFGINIKVIDNSYFNADFIEPEVSKYNLVIINTIEPCEIYNHVKNIVPTVWYIREAENLPNFFWKKERYHSIINAYKLYSVSEYAAKFIFKNYNKNVKVLHNCVDDVYLAEGYSIADKTEKNKIKFLTLGTIEKRKAQDILIDAFLSLPKNYREQCEIHFAGRKWDGAKNFYPQILSLAEKNDDIFYHGEIREKEAIYQLIANCDVMVVPSLDESCSLPALEGAMMSKPLILSKNIGAKYVLDKNSGWLVETGNIMALRNAFMKAIDNKAQLSKMGAKSRANYLATSTFEIYEKNILKMIADNISESAYFTQIKHFDSKFKLYSFDIFDTIITRKVAEPSGIFLIMQEKLKKYNNFSQFFVNNFIEIRKNAEIFIYRSLCKDGKYDTDINEIYNVISNDFDLDEVSKNMLISLEIETELENLMPISSNIELIKELIKQNKYVVLISDMYLSSDIIRKFLLKFDDIFKDIKIYVSCEYNKKKNNGLLFKEVKKIENINYSDWFHCGDNKNGDFVQAKKLGIAVRYFNFPNLMKYEEKLLQKYPKSISIQYLIGIARNIRVDCGVNEKFSLGASLGGPILYLYVAWIIENARSKKIKNLYFIARDGYILKQIADILISKMSLDMKTAYLYCSRMSVRDPYLANDLKAIKNIRGYFEQEIDFSLPFAFIEFTGTGNTVECACSIIGENNLSNFKGTFYLNCSGNPFIQKTKAYSMLHLNNRFSTCFELLVRAPHGQTLHYEYQNNKYIPILEDTEGKLLVEYRYKDYIEGVLEFAKNISIDLNYSFDMLLYYLEYINSKDVDLVTVNVLGAIPFTLDGEFTNVQYAPPLDVRFAGDIVAGKKKYHGERIDWSLMRSYRINDKSNDNCLDLQAENKKLQTKLNNTRNSMSYKIGRVITWLPRLINRKIKGK